jgi:phospholipase C
MHEKHSFDNYFGTYPGTNGIPNNTHIPKNLQNLSLGCITSFRTSSTSLPDLYRDYKASITAYDNGKCRRAK